MASSPLLIKRAEAEPPHAASVLGSSMSTLRLLDVELTALVVELARERASTDAVLCGVPISARAVRGIARRPTAREARGMDCAGPWPLATTPPAPGRFVRPDFSRPRVAELARLAAHALSPRARMGSLVHARKSHRVAVRTRSRKRLALPIGLVCVGSVLTADAVATMVWQEPVSALYTSHQQQVLAAELLNLQRTYTRSPLESDQLSRQRLLSTLAQRLERSSRAGQPLGRISARSIGMNFVLVQGTDTSSLTKGPGHYRGTTLPGAPGTTAFAGHRTTFLSPFRRVAELNRGASVVVTMPYGKFSYVVLGQRVVAPTDVSVLSRAGGSAGSQLVLTTCDPVYSAARRRIVVAKLVSAVPTGAARV